MPKRKRDLRVGIYARRSRPDEGEGSIPDQIRACRERAEEEGWEVVGEPFIDDGISAWNPRKVRPAYRRLLEEIEAGRIDAPLARDDERLMRQDKDGRHWLDLAEEGRVKYLLFADVGDTNLATADGRRSLRERVAAAEYYSDRLSEKIKQTHMRKAEEGRRWGGGRRPFGYQQQPGGVLVVDETEAAMIREAVERILSGDSLYSVAQEWNERRTLRAYGGRWRWGDVRRVVAGVRTKKGWTDSHAASGLVRGERVAQWEPIISADDHERIRALLDGGKMEAGRQAKQRRWVLAGVVFCAECGAAISGSRSFRNSGRIARRYQCRASNGGCGRVSAQAAGLEYAVIEEAAQLAGIAETVTRRGSRREPDAEALAELRQIEERRKELPMMYARGELRPADVAAARRELDKLEAPVRAKLRDAMHDLEGKGPITEKMITPDWLDRPHTEEEVEAANQWLRATVRATVRKPKSRGARWDRERVKVEPKVAV